MDKYKLMRMAESLEEDAIKFDEVEELFPSEGNSAEEIGRASCRERVSSAV